MINTVKIIPDTVVDGPGMRTAIYLSGCYHHCVGCHGKDTWPKNCGTDYSIAKLVSLVDDYQHKRVTISGGDPFCYQTIELINLLKQLKSHIKEVNIWVYTGYTFEKLKMNKTKAQALKYIDVLVDGPFIESLKSSDCLFKGSSNQRLIDVQKTLQENKIFLYEN